MFELFQPALSIFQLFLLLSLVFKLLPSLGDAPLRCLHEVVPIAVTNLNAILRYLLLLVGLAAGVVRQRGQGPGAGLLVLVHVFEGLRVLHCELVEVVLGWQEFGVALGELAFDWWGLLPRDYLVPALS